MQLCLGMLAPLLTSACTGYGQTELSVDSFVDPDEFGRRTIKPYTMQKYGRILFLISEKEGSIQKINYLDEIEKLPSMFYIKMHYHEGDCLEKTETLDNCPGAFMFCHKSWDVIEKDYNTIRTFEKQGIFELE